jgi:hypothetical protein
MDEKKRRCSIPSSDQDWSTLNTSRRRPRSAVKLVETAAKLGLTANFTYPGEQPAVAEFEPSAPKPEDADKARFMRQNGDLIKAWTLGSRLMREAGFGPGKGKVALVKAWASDGLIVALPNEMDLLIPWASLNREVPHALYPMTVQGEAEMDSPAATPKRRGRPPGSKSKAKQDGQPQTTPKPANKPAEAPKKGKGPNVIKVWSKGGKLYISSTYPPPYMVCKDRRTCGWDWNKQDKVWFHPDNAEGARTSRTEAPSGRRDDGLGAGGQEQADREARRGPQGRQEGQVHRQAQEQQGQEAQHGLQDGRCGHERGAGCERCGRGRRGCGQGRGRW